MGSFQIKKPHRRAKGSLTVFAAISCMLVAELLFTLAEGVRWVELHRMAAMNTEAVGEALLAQYCIPLWEQYQILGCDPDSKAGEDFSMQDMEKEAMALTDMNFLLADRMQLLPQYNLLRLAAAEAKLEEEELLTDGDGACFIKAVSAYMKENLLYEETRFALSDAKELYSLYEAVRSITEDGGFSLDKIADALGAIRDEEIQEAGSISTPSPAPGSRESNPDMMRLEEKSEAENILKKAKNFMSKGILRQVLPDDSDQVSQKEIMLKETVSHRTLQQGRGTASIDFMDRMLFEQYLLSRFGCYTGQKEGHGELCYELEYLLGGKSADSANLAVAAGELLAVREACNLAYLAADSEKKAALHAFAATISGVTANPVLGEAVRTGLTIAWAYAESVMDVRALLAGKKIPAIKSDATWTCTLENIGKVFDGSMQSVESAHGIGYRSWIGILLFTKRAEGNAMRAMDLMENHIRQKKGYESFLMDHVVTAVKLTMHYRYSPLFLDFVSLQRAVLPSEVIKDARLRYAKKEG